MHCKRLIFILGCLFLMQPGFALEPETELWMKEQAQKADNLTLSIEDREWMQQQANDFKEPFSVLLEEDRKWMEKQQENLKETFVQQLKNLSKQPSNAEKPLKKDLFQGVFSEQDTQLFVLVSFSMPKESLKAWSLQAQRAGGVLVLRGLVENSLKKTLQKAHEIFGSHSMGDLRVDPTLFKAYNIQKVPAVVLVQDFSKLSEEEGIVFGDVGLSYALKKMSELEKTKKAANHYLSLLERK